MIRDNKGRFVKGIVMPPEWIEKFRIARQNRDQRGDKNTSWKGDNITYKGLHKWVHSNLPKPDLCEHCKQQKPYDVANKGTYNRDFNNWEWLCRRCHLLSDGRMKNNLKQYRT